MGKRNHEVVDALLEGILDHYKRAKAENDAGRMTGPLEQRSPRGFAISYGELIDFTGVSIIPLAAGGYLYEVAEICEGRGWHPIQSLVVNKLKGWPGAGFKGSAGAAQDFASWRDHIHKMISDPKFPEKTSGS